MNFQLLRADDLTVSGGAYSEENEEKELPNDGFPPAGSDGNSTEVAGCESKELSRL